jgi:hypothetical protein
MLKSSHDIEIDAKLGTIMKGLNNEILNGLRSISNENASIIVDYILTMYLYSATSIRFLVPSI